MTDPALLANLAAYSVQVACIVAGGAILVRLVRIDVAAIRYQYWRALLVLCLALPWIQRRQAPASAPGQVTETMTVAAAGSVPDAAGAWSIPWTTLVVAVLVTGTLLRLAWLGLGLWRLRGLRTAGVDAGPGAEVDELVRVTGARASIRYVDGIEQPMTFGLFSPVVLLPPALRAQPAEIRRAVLCHELVHVRRRDWAAVLVEEAVRAAFWFHPAMWWLVSRVQLAREEAVDEQAVLVTGSRRAYMRALLAFADHAPLSPAPAFGRRRHLFHRMVLISQEAVMSSTRIVFNCAVLAMLVTAGSVLAVGAMPMVQGAGAAGQAGPGPLESRANPVTPENPIPRRIHAVPVAYPAEVVGADVRGVVSLRVTLDNAGRVAEARKVSAYMPATPIDPAARQRYEEAFARAAIESVLQWQYEPPANAPIAFTVTFAFRPERDAALLEHTPSSPRETGATAPPPPPPPPPLDWHIGALKVGGNIKPPTKVKDVHPVYPAAAREAGVEGVVILEARIDENGRVSHARVLKSIPLLDQAALDAVQQWEFQPTLMNGAPVPVIMTVTIAFHLDKDGQ
ncbi:MAG TPA: M56 family metallopeptidase [Vicinamibacterales bacterium]